MTSSPRIKRLVTFLRDRDFVMDTYIDVLELQKRDIETSDMDAFAEHSRMEAELIDRLEALHRVVVPLRGEHGGADAGGAEEVRRLDAAFERKCQRAIEKNRENQGMIRSELKGLKAQLSGLRKFSARTGASYLGSSQRHQQPRYIDFEQ
jgi:hypothetical protein